MYTPAIPVASSSLWAWRVILAFSKRPYMAEDNIIKFIRKRDYNLVKELGQP